MGQQARILAVRTAVPPYRLKQGAVKQRVAGLFGRQGYDVERLLPAFDNAGIGQRHASRPLEWHEGAQGWAERAAAYEETALALLEEAAGACLEAAGVRPEEVDDLVQVSSTGIATPSLEALLMDRMAFRPEVQRLPIFGLGCAGGVIGLGQAARLAEAQPGRKLLLLVVELCSVNFRPQDLSKANVIASALFGDGAAAVLISTDAPPGAPVLAAARQHRWPGTRGVMGWKVEEDGLGVVFSRDIPSLVRRELPPLLADFLGKEDLALEDLAHSACHPGGAKVVAALEEVLARPLPLEREILQAYGNMSAPTALFVLERVLRDAPELRGPLLSTALGPGFTAAFQLLLPGERR